MTFDWRDRRVLVTGGASFIGSHLVDRLSSKGAQVTVVDDLSSGTLDNLTQTPAISFVKMDLEYSKLPDLVRVFKGHEMVFHLAAAHGGRGYIDAHPADVSSNFAIDHHTFEAACRADVGKVVFASSACVYPPIRQRDERARYLLRESDCDTRNLDGSFSADLEYGWAKLMGEVQLHSFIKQYGMKGAILRFVTAYGERENETHAIVALIYKAHERMNPYLIWGTGEQSRDFTYVSDIVEGTILAAERVSDGSPINLGTGKRHKLDDVAAMILQLMNFHPTIQHEVSRPVGVVNRALDIRVARTLLGWEPKVSMREGLRRTITWYVRTHPREGRVNEHILTERRRPGSRPLLIDARPEERFQR